MSNFASTATMTGRLGLVVVVAGMGVAMNGCASAKEKSVSQAWKEVMEKEYPTLMTDTPGLGTGTQAQTQPARDSAAEKVGGNVGGLGEKATVAEMVEYAMKHNPGLQASWRQWEAAIKAVPGARLPADPKFVFQYDGMAKQRTYGVAQMVPWPWKLDAMGEQMAEDAGAMQKKFEMEKRTVEAGVKNAWAEYVYVERATGIMQTMVELMRDLEKASENRLRTGQGSQTDLIGVQMDLEKAESGLEGMKLMRGSVKAKVNMWLGRGAEANLPAAGWEDAGAGSEGGQVKVEELMARLRDENPELGMMMHEVAAARAGVKAARLERIPEMEVQVDYMEDDEDMEDVGVMVGMTLPVWEEKYETMAAGALAKFGAAQAARQNRMNQMESELWMAVFKWEDAKRRVGLYEKKLIPKAKKNVESLTGNVGAGQGELMDLLMAKQAAKQLELDLERAKADGYQAMAEIEMMAGAGAEKK